VVAEVYDPDTAVAAGFLDRVVGTAELASTARDVAGQLRTLDMDAHTATKLRARNKALTAIRMAIDLDYGDAAPQRLRARAL
jgi:enoyl-CoA hydratase